MRKKQVLIQVLSALCGFLVLLVVLYLIFFDSLFSKSEKLKPSEIYQGDKIKLEDTYTYEPVYSEVQSLHIPQHPQIPRSKAKLTLCYEFLQTPINGNYQTRFMVALVHPEAPARILAEGRQLDGIPFCWSFNFEPDEMDKRIYFNLFYEQHGGPSYVVKVPTYSIQIEHNAKPYRIPQIVDHVGDRFRKLERRVKKLEEKYGL